MTTTAREIRAAMQALAHHEVFDHFNRDGPDHDIAPLLVCEGVSADVFNAYVGDGECLPIGVRFLELDGDGRLWVVDSATRAHETTKCRFECALIGAFGTSREISLCGSMTAHRAGLPVKEADATYGPLAHTPHRTPPPPGVAMADWLTLAVEIGHHQSWASLQNAARWWHGYAGIKYVLLLKVSVKKRSLCYQLYDVELRPLGPRGGLPQPVLTGRVRRNENGSAPDILALNARRLLSIPEGLPLPAGVNERVSVDLQDVLEIVMESLAPF